MTPYPRRKGILDILFFSWANSVWFGIATLVAIFIYSSIGSAIPPLRQHALLEMTEMEWFHWWPFKVLIALLCINMVTVTIRQIPLRLMNAGVWTIHTGIIILALGSVYYFSTKLEGDIPVFRRRALIELPGRAEPVSMVVRTNNHLSTVTETGKYHFSIAQIFPDWQIASGDDKGKKAYMVWIDVITPEQQYTRQLLAGYPEYTEDILPDRTRAKKTLGKPLVDESVTMTLDYEPQTEFYLMDSAALYARRAGADAWIERPIRDLPHYHERIASYDDVAMPPGTEDIPLRPIDLPVPPAEEPGDPLADYDVRVTSFLRYAFMTSTWHEGGERINPVVNLTLHTTSGARSDHELVAFDPSKNSAEEGLLQFKWVDTPEELERLAVAGDGMLTIRAPNSGAELEVPLSGERTTPAEDRPFIPINGTNYAYRIKNVVNNLPVKSGRLAGQTISVAMVEIKDPDGEIVTRFVADDPEATRDVTEAGHSEAPDPAIEMTFTPGNRAVITVVAAPGDVGLHVLVRNPDDRIERHAVEAGRPIQIRDELFLTVNRMMTHAERDLRPRVVPLAQRQRNAREMFSMIRVELSKDDWTHTRWLQFNRYAFPNDQYAVPRRFSYLPEVVALPDGRTVELMFSRERADLPAPIALEKFELATHTGGYTGQTITIRDFVSKLRFKTSDGWSEPVRMSSNNPASYGGFWYFQSEWDPPGQGNPGMTYTGLGVGNRNGVHIQLAGTAIAIAGMIFAFYVKPIIRRRRQLAGLARTEARSTATASEVPEEETVVSV
jgi:hypothetical protein